MIRKILKLKNVGLLQDAAQGGAVEIPRVCCVYAENGRGKSTFAAVMRACGLGDGSRLNARRTIDSPGSPEVAFLLPTGSQLEYKANAWSGPSPNIIVFDSEFVEQNVYSGFEVRAEQRQALLEFALGDQMVQLKQQVDQLTRDIDTQTRRRSQAEKELSGYAAPYSVQDFVALSVIPDAQQQIEILQKRIEAARNIQQISARQLPGAVQSIQIDLQPILDVLARQLQDVEQSAEAIVKAHLAKHVDQGFEDWVGTGQAYLTNSECPFCAQAIDGLDLIKAYRSHFNKAYNDLKQDLAFLSQKVDVVLADSKADQLRAAAETNTARIEAWKDQIDVSAPVLAIDGLLTTLKRARESIYSLLAKKHTAPLDAVGSADELSAVTAKVDAAAMSRSVLNGEAVAAPGFCICQTH